ncbi:unnamed protein product, partial [Allacma fusca]
MFQWEDLQNYTDPDTRIPGTKSEKTGRIRRDHYDIDYWKYQYYLCQWGIELYEEAGNQTKVDELIRTKIRLNLYFLKQNYPDIDQWVLQEIRKRQPPPTAKVLSATAAAAATVPASETPKATRKYNYLAERLQAAKEGGTGSPKVLAFPVEETLRRRQNFKFHIVSPTNFTVELPRHFNAGNLPTDDDFVVIFRKFQKAVAKKLAVELNEEFYQEFVDILKLYIVDQIDDPSISFTEFHSILPEEPPSPEAKAEEVASQQQAKEEARFRRSEVQLQQEILDSGL